MLVSAAKILPSQDYLKPETIKFIYTCVKTGALEKLPPAPIVRKDSLGNLIAIDGHNLIAVKLALGEEIDVHLAKTKDDGLPADSYANISRNTVLKNKFESVLEENKRLQNSGIKTFNDLMSQYADLFQQP